MAAARQHESYGRIAQNVEFINRASGRDVIRLRSGRKNWNPQISQRHRSPVDLETTFRKIVVQKQRSKIF